MSRELSQVGQGVWQLAVEVLVLGGEVRFQGGQRERQGFVSIGTGGIDHVLGFMPVGDRFLAIQRGVRSALQDSARITWLQPAVTKRRERMQDALIQFLGRQLLTKLLPNRQFLPSRSDGTVRSVL